MRWGDINIHIHININIDIIINIDIAIDIAIDVAIDIAMSTCLVARCLNVHASGTGGRLYVHASRPGLGLCSSNHGLCCSHNGVAR